jgi:branched-chain amino acid transport system ATP-binding protein
MSTETRAPVLQVAGLRRAFGGLVAVNDLGFDVAQGEIMGLLGPNGSGKTTALNLMSGVLRPDAGSIRLMGRDIAGLAAYKISRLGLARTFQLVRVLDGMDCRENIRAGLAFQKPHLAATEAEARIDLLLERVGLGGQDRRPAADLTYIDRKRLELARALATHPRVLLLDEVAGGLTEHECRGLVDLVRNIHRLGVSIIWIEHVVHALVAVVDRLVVLHGGGLIGAGDPRTVINSPAVREIYMGIPADA